MLLTAHKITKPEETKCALEIIFLVFFNCFCIFSIRFGPRFPALSNAYDSSLAKIAKATAQELGYSSFMQEGVYCAQVGPAFESPAECRFLHLVSLGLKTFVLKFH